MLTLSDAPAATSTAQLRGVARARRVLVTDGDQRAALAAVRSLGRAGYHCVVCAPQATSLAGSSRFAARSEAVPDAGRTPDAFVAAIRRVVEEQRIELVLPISEPALLALLPERDTLAARVPFPAAETFRAICDKGLVLRAASEVGIRVPRQHEIASAAEGRVLSPPLPVVLKPYRSVYTAADGTRGKVGVQWAHDAAEYERALASYPAAAYPVLVQEAITGPGLGVFVLLHEGRVAARFAHRRLREKPPSGGVSVLCRSEPLDDVLLQRSVALLERFNWAGVAMVEYKQDARTGEPVLMEINGRLWGSLQLAIDAGVDFPRLLADLAFGDVVRPVTTYARVRSRWFWGDTDHLITRLSHRRNLRDAAAAVWTWLSGFAPWNRSEVLRWRDPAPFAWETTRWFRHITQR